MEEASEDWELMMKKGGNEHMGLSSKCMQDHIGVCDKQQGGGGV